MLEVDAVLGVNPFYVGGSNKQVPCLDLLAHSNACRLFHL
jgi:hypothetical protein